jgi:hypothetical protein
MNCIEQQGSGWNNGGITTHIFPIHKTIDTAVDKLELELEIFI